MPLLLQQLPALLQQFRPQAGSIYVSNSRVVVLRRVSLPELILCLHSFV